MDADDIAYPERLEIQFNYMESNKDVLAIGTQFKYYHQNEICERPLKYPDILRSLLRYNCFLHPSMMIRHQAMLHVGGYNEQYVYASDYDLMCRLALFGKMENLPDVLMKYRSHENQISSKYRKEQRLYADLIRKNYQQGFITKFKSQNLQIPNKIVFKTLNMGEVISCYIYARKTGNTDYERHAESLLDHILNNIMDYVISIDDIVSLGLGVIYLLNNQFICGDQDEVLSEFDLLLKKTSYSKENLTNETKFHLLQYFIARINSKTTNSLEQIKNHIVFEDSDVQSELIRAIELFDKYE